jgi:hypothetical protein
MKGYKGFEPGLVCRGKQYQENTIAEAKSAVICHTGLHFCENPMDVLDHYPILNDKGEFNEFVAVEALDEVKTGDNKKYYTTKLKIGTKLTIPRFIKACVDFMVEKTTVSDTAASGNYAQLAASGDAAKLAASGYAAKLAASGAFAQLAASGDAAKLAASGYAAKLAASGAFAKLAASGYAAKLAASGNAAKLAASGYAAKLAASGNAAKLAASGYAAKLAASGNAAKLAASGKDSVVAGIGVNNTARAAKGCWITLAEWTWDDEKDRYIPVCVKTEFVDGERIKADTWYTLKNGEFTEM